jgi:RNA polymerase-binding transcription factor DksA
VPLLVAMVDRHGLVELAFGPHLAEQAIEREDDDALDAEEGMAAARWRAIDAALARLRAGTYGICTRCGEAIAPARLTAMPEAPTCIACARGA